ncbi:MAG: helix-turn-helix domain-containing protein [Lachnospiraceae bacterium]|nr:helix-turn-helix domain-containing protein [Lachnospiraceae bacterium]
MMNENEKVSFGKYIETLRKKREKSLRETAKAIEVSPQFYSEVEKGRRGAFTKERLEKLAIFLMLDENETHTLYDIAAKARTSNDVVVPQDCVDYVSGNPFVVEALRLSKETGAGEKEWQILLDELKARKG